MSSQETARRDDAEANNGSSGAIIRYGIVAVLCFLALKPYFTRKTEEPQAPKTFHVQGVTMGTEWSASVATSATNIIKANEAEKSSDPEETISSCEEFLARVIQRELDAIDKSASTYRSDSDVMRFNASTSNDWIEVSASTAEIVKLALEIAEKTSGAFDPTAGPIVNLYRFGPNKAPLTALPSEEEIANARSLVGYSHLESRLLPTPALRKSKPGITLDLSGIAKGYAVDQAARALETLGFNDYMIEVGGEIRAKGNKIVEPSGEKKPWILGVQTPEIAGQSGEARARAPQLYLTLAFGEVESACALATSGDYRNFLQVGDARFSHIVDPRSGKPTELILSSDEGNKERLGSVTVASTNVGDFSCAAVDAFATALFVLGEKEGIKLADDLGLPVVFLYRSDDSALQLREVASKAFDEKLQVERLK